MIDKLILVSLSAIIIPPVSPLRRWYCPRTRLLTNSQSFSIFKKRFGHSTNSRKNRGLYKSVIGSRAGLCEEKGSLLATGGICELLRPF